MSLSKVFIKSLCSFSILGLVCCTPTENISTSASEAAFKNMPDRWRVTCVDGAGAMSVPIFWDLKSFNEETGQMELEVTDRDGIKGKANARILNNKIETFGKSADLDENYNFSFDVDICPGGMKGVALN